MKLAGFLIVCSIALLYSPQTVFGAFIEVPDEFLFESELFGEEPLRAKRQVQLQGQGSEKSGYLSFQGQKNLYQNPNTKLDATLNAQTQWAQGYKPQHGGSLRLDGQQNLFNNGRTQVTGNGFAERNVGTGMRPHDSFGAGVGVSHNIYSGRNGQVDAFAGYQRQWNTPSKHNAMGGIRWRF